MKDLTPKSRAPVADHRAWDAVGHTKKIAIPALFNFNESLCKVTQTTAVQ
jgi:hypothetical protein